MKKMITIIIGMMLIFPGISVYADANTNNAYIFYLINYDGEVSVNESYNIENINEKKIIRRIEKNKGEAIQIKSIKCEVFDDESFSMVGIYNNLNEKNNYTIEENENEWILTICVEGISNLRKLEIEYSIGRSLIRNDDLLWSERTIYDNSKNSLKLEEIILSNSTDYEGIWIDAENVNNEDGNSRIKIGEDENTKLISAKKYDDYAKGNISKQNKQYSKDEYDSKYSQSKLKKANMNNAPEDKVQVVLYAFLGIITIFILIIIVLIIFINLKKKRARIREDEHEKDYL